ncbi:MAG: DUF6029 family protein [Candidatus Cloacimonadia bacterium]
MSKRYHLYVLVVFLLTISPIFSQVSITGQNESEYTYKAVPDSLNNFFENETNIRLDYQNIEIGFSFLAYLPKYDQFEAIKDLNSDDVNYRWDDRYIQLNLSSMNVRAGTFTEHFGNGLILRSYEDKPNQHDTRLNGLLVNLNDAKYTLKGLYGTLANQDNPAKKDVINGVDLSVPLANSLQIGGSFTYQQIRRFDDKYRTRMVFGGRAEYFYDFFDINAEYAQSKAYHDIVDDKKGEALYVIANTYFNAFTLTGGYKNYNNFDDRMNELPMLNSSEEPLSDRFVTGYDEEGLYGQIGYTPNYSTALELAYSEAWNSDFSIRQSDLLASAQREFEDIVVFLEYAQLEEVDKVQSKWLREMTPAAAFDFNLYGIPTHIRGEFGIEKRVEDEVEERGFNPLLQTDFTFKKFSFSLISEMEFDDFSSLSEAEYWIGAEFVAPLFSHTDLKLFVGEEKGGKVCRNGMCSHTTPFKGLKLNLTTRF